MGPAEAESWRRCRSIQVEEMAEAVPESVRAQPEPTPSSGSTRNGASDLLPTGWPLKKPTGALRFLNPSGWSCPFCLSVFELIFACFLRPYTNKMLPDR